MKHKRGLILFAKSPSPGKVKTRLEPVLDTETILALYKQLLARQISLVNRCDLAQKFLWVDGNPTMEMFQSFEGEILVQLGGGIGERMGAALKSSLEHCDSVILIGCDSPGLDATMIEEAFQVLEAGKNAVFVPAMDGGYVLVGLNLAADQLFRDITWGSGQVMEQTRQKMIALGVSWKELEPVRDIDEPADLEHLLHYGDEFSELLEGVDFTSISEC